MQHLHLHSRCPYRHSLCLHLLPCRCGGSRCSNIVTTILSNPCLCNKQQEPVGFFSNPNVKVRIRNTWQTLGIATKADCARGIRETAVAVSSYR